MKRKYLNANTTCKSSRKKSQVIWPSPLPEPGLWRRQSPGWSLRPQTRGTAPAPRPRCAAGSQSAKQITSHLKQGFEHTTLSISDKNYTDSHVVICLLYRDRKLCIWFTVGGAQSACLPPWLETQMAATPTSRAFLASSRHTTPFTITGSFEMLQGYHGTALTLLSYDWRIRRGKQCFINIWDWNNQGRTPYVH